MGAVAGADPGSASCSGCSQQWRGSWRPGSRSLACSGGAAGSGRHDGPMAANGTLDRREQKNRSSLPPSALRCCVLIVSTSGAELELIAWREAPGDSERGSSPRFFLAVSIWGRRSPRPFNAVVFKGETLFSFVFTRHSLSPPLLPLLPCAYLLLLCTIAARFR
jgi:hypothetical protein